MESKRLFLVIIYFFIFVLSVYFLYEFLHKASEIIQNEKTDKKILNINGREYLSEKYFALILVLGVIMFTIFTSFLLLYSNYYMSHKTNIEQEMTSTVDHDIHLQLKRREELKKLKKSLEEWNKQY